MNQKQTAVEWLISNIENSIMCDHINGVEMWDKDTIFEFLEQAIEMEMEQLREAFKSGRIVCLDNTRSKTPVSMTADDYFTETYGKL